MIEKSCHGNRSSGDIHICGTCNAKFSDIESFLLHKKNEQSLEEPSPSGIDDQGTNDINTSFIQVLTIPNLDDHDLGIENGAGNHTLLKPVERPYRFLILSSQNQLNGSGLENPGSAKLNIQSYGVSGESAGVQAQSVDSEYSLCTSSIRPLTSANNGTCSTTTSAFSTSSGNLGLESHHINRTLPTGGLAPISTVLTEPIKISTTSSSDLAPMSNILTTETGVFSSPTGILASQRSILSSSSGIFTSPSNVLTFPSGFLRSSPDIFTSPSSVLASSSNVFNSPSEILSSPGSILTSSANSLSSASYAFTSSPSILTTASSDTTVASDVLTASSSIESSTADEPGISSASQPASSNQEEPPAAPKKCPFTQIRENGVRKYKCGFSNCKYMTSHTKDLNRHFRTHTGERPFSCPQCGKRFTRKDKLLSHQRCHSGAKPFICTQCSYATNDKSSLKKHARIHTGERPFKCQLCSYASRNSSQLIVHLRVHTGDAPFTCTVCSANFKINSDLKRHMRLHTGEKPYACTQCDYRSAIKSNLVSHFKLKHTGGEPLRCSQCDFQTPFRKELQLHERVHISKPMKCEECPYSSNTRTSLKNHQRIHSEEKPFQCKVCSFSSRQSCNVGTHMKKRHPEYVLNSKKQSDGQDSDSQKKKARPSCSASFKCSYCSMTFVRKDSLNSHLRQHTDSKSEPAALAMLQLQETGQQSVEDKTEDDPKQKENNMYLNQPSTCTSGDIPSSDVSLLGHQNLEISVEHDLSLITDNISSTFSSPTAEPLLTSVHANQVMSSDRLSNTHETFSHQHCTLNSPPASTSEEGTFADTEAATMLTLMQSQPSPNLSDHSVPITDGLGEDQEASASTISHQVNARSQEYILNDNSNSSKSLETVNTRLVYQLPSNISVLTTPIISLNNQDPSPSVPDVGILQLGQTPQIVRPSQQPAMVQYLIHPQNPSLQLMSQSDLQGVDTDRSLGPLGLNVAPDMRLMLSVLPVSQNGQNSTFSFPDSPATVSHNVAKSVIVPVNSVVVNQTAEPVMSSLLVTQLSNQQNV